MSDLMQQMDELMTRTLAMQQARIDEAWLDLCEEAGWVAPKDRRYTPRDVRRLARTRRLRDHLDLDENAIDIVLHMRRQIINLQREMSRMEQRERALRDELRRLQLSNAIDGFFEF